MVWQEMSKESIIKEDYTQYRSEDIEECVITLKGR